MPENSILYRLFCLRFDNGYTQHYIANVLGVSREVYCYLENGRRELKLWHIMRLSRFYNVTTDYILFGSE